MAVAEGTGQQSRLPHALVLVAAVAFCFGSAWTNVVIRWQDLFLSPLSGVFTSIGRLQREKNAQCFAIVET